MARTFPIRGAGDRTKLYCLSARCEDATVMHLAVLVVATQTLWVHPMPFESVEKLCAFAHKCTSRGYGYCDLWTAVDPTEVDSVETMMYRTAL